MTSIALTAPASLADATAATRQPAPRTGVVALDHAMKARALQSNLAALGIGNTAATAQLIALGFDLQSLRELLEMQQAVWDRLRVLQDNWVQGFSAWVTYADQIKGANTMSKLVERELNIGAQFAQLVGDQITGLAGLAENVQVDYSYWVNEKLNEKRAGASWFGLAK